MLSRLHPIVGLSSLQVARRRCDRLAIVSSIIFYRIWNKCIFIQFACEFQHRHHNTDVSKSIDIRVVEVGPRDGLQNEAKFIDTDVKVEFINRLSKVGLSTIEVTRYDA